MNTIIVGATRGIGRAIARELAARGDRLFVLGRNADQLEKTAADLVARGHKEQVGTALCDLTDASTFAPALAAAKAALGKVDCLVITAGMFGTQDQLEADLSFTESLLQANFTGTILLCEHARPLLLADGGGTLCVLSSVAGDRGRKPVALYGASKAGLSYYLEAMDHKYRAEGMTTVCIKPGFVRTGMTAGLKPPPFAGDPEPVAKRVVRAIDRGEPLVYTPMMWRWVMLVIRSLPRFAMRKIGF
ncbi:MAG: SDR family NAD(P)-dependent oxidoreductase [Myxococcales bacterium]|nr:SDR family NAD(P)-dependent oxidoreductase [Myxococcales bacterium]